jgi:hypothetical protein
MVLKGKVGRQTKRELGEKLSPGLEPGPPKIEKERYGNIMTSHEYAKKLRIAADFFLSKPEFKLRNSPLLFASYWADKDGFLAAVKALGKGEKKYEGESLKFIVTVAPDLTFDVEVSRSAVCRLVKPAQPAEYECEPLLSQEEESSLGGAA